IPSWRLLLRHLIPCAFCFDLPSAGRSMDARIAMIAITTSNSISVNALGARGDLELSLNACMGYATQYATAPEVSLLQCIESGTAGDSRRRCLKFPFPTRNHRSGKTVANQ